jgi:hypothetical protein
VQTTLRDDAHLRLGGVTVCGVARTGRAMASPCHRLASETTSKHARGPDADALPLERPASTILSVELVSGTWNLDTATRVAVVVPHDVVIAVENLPVAVVTCPGGLPCPGSDLGTDGVETVPLWQLGLRCGQRCRGSYLYGLFLGLFRGEAFVEPFVGFVADVMAGALVRASPSLLRIASCAGMQRGCGRTVLEGVAMA